MSDKSITNCQFMPVYLVNPVSGIGQADLIIVVVCAGVLRL